MANRRQSATMHDSTEAAPDQGVGRSDTAVSTITQTVGRLRNGSVSAANRLLEYNPSRGMWPAFGTAVAHAPNITDLRSPGEVQFDAHGHSAKDGNAKDINQEWKVERRATLATLNTTNTNTNNKTEKDARGAEIPLTSYTTSSRDDDDRTDDSDSIAPKVPWSVAAKKGLYATWKFVITPTGFFITVYGLNVVGWGAMLFFLLLKVGPMNQENKDIWVEIDSQILNALFCLTSWGLAPWRFRDLYWVTVWRFGSGTKSKESIRRLAERNQSWFRRRESDLTDDDENLASFAHQDTYTGMVASPTATWKMDFVVWCMVFNSLFQVGMATFMWYYNRHDRPPFGVGLFIGLGCFSSLLGGIMCWWEGRKIKLVEGPKVKPKQVEGVA